MLIVIYASITLMFIVIYVSVTLSWVFKFCSPAAERLPCRGAFPLPRSVSPAEERFLILARRLWTLENKRNYVKRLETAICTYAGS